MPSLTNLSESVQRSVKNVLDYIEKNQDGIKEQYLTVKTDTGRNRNNKIYEKIDLLQYQRELLSVSVVILTANYFESEILNYNVNKESNKKIMMLDGGVPLLGGSYRVDAYLMELFGYKILHLHTNETGSNTPCGSTDLVRYISSCEYLAPSCVVSFGICFGVNCDEYSLGDTLIAKRIYPWSIGVKINETGWNIKCDEFIIDLQKGDSAMFNKIKRVIESADSFCPDQKADLVNMLTSEAVVNNEQVKIEAIQNAYTCQIAGGEMEGYGLAKECLYYADLPCVILKAICDWGVVKDIDRYVDISGLTSNYKDHMQAYAAYCAYRVLSELFKQKALPYGNFIEKLCNSILTDLYPDGAVSKLALTEYIKNYFVKNFPKFTHLSPKDGESVLSVAFNLIKDEIFIPSVDEKMYFFKNWLI